MKVVVLVMIGVLLSPCYGIAAEHAEPPSPAHSQEQLTKILTSEEYSTRHTKSEWVSKTPLKPSSKTNLSWLERMVMAFQNVGRFLGVVGKMLAIVFLGVVVWLIYKNRQLWLSWVGKYRRQNIPSVLAVQTPNPKITPQDTLPPKDELFALLKQLIAQERWVQALSYLYRSTLHEMSDTRHFVIAHYHTEEQCVQLVRHAKTPTEQRYLEALVALWSACAYGRHTPKDKVDHTVLLQLVDTWATLYGAKR